MFCNQCGKEIPDGIKFCPSCGASIPQKEQTGTTQTPAPEVSGQPAAGGMNPGTDAAVQPQLGSMKLPGTSQNVQWILSCVLGALQFLSAVVFWWVGSFAVSATVSMFGFSQNQSESISLHDLFDWTFFSVIFMIFVLLSAVWTILRVVDEKVPLPFLAPVRRSILFRAPFLPLATGVWTLLVFLFQWITGAGEVSDALDLMLGESGLGSLGSSLAEVSFHISFGGVVFLLFILATIGISAYLLVCELSRKKTTPPMM